MNVENTLLRRMPARVRDWDAQVVSALRRLSVPLLRIALGIVFVWFGVLKVTGASPVVDLVEDTLIHLPWAPSVAALGWIEIALGLGLITMILPRLTLALFLVQMVGTFLVFVFTPRVAFQSGNPLLLTVEGEFVIKNLVLLTAGLVIASTVRPTR